MNHQDYKNALEWIEDPAKNPLPPKMACDGERDNMPVDVYKAIFRALTLLSDERYAVVVRENTVWSAMLNAGEVR